jgi:DNA-binding transcriptional ArsR family regulator
MRRDVFLAISDPTRRAIINLLASRSLNLNAVSEHFDISRPAISRHIKILKQCGLIEIHKKGRERICKVTLDQLGLVNDWISQYKDFWNKKLNDLDDYIKTSE